MGPWRLARRRERQQRALVYVWVEVALLRVAEVERLAALNHVILP